MPTSTIQGEKPGGDGFLSPWREYSKSNRNVFLEEALRFILGAGNSRDELATIRKTAQARRQSLLCKAGKSGRPRGSKRAHSPTDEKITSCESDQSVREGLLDWDEHSSFRHSCIVCGDFSHLRPAFLGQILLFIESADKRELAAIREAVAQRAKSRGVGGIVKKHGRPCVLDDEKKLYEGKLVAWRRIIDHRSARWIAEELGLPITKAGVRYAGNIDSIRRRLRRMRDYLSAAIWEAVQTNWVIPCDEPRKVPELKPGILDHKPAQQWLWIKAGLPFKEHPDECKKIVMALWPRAEAAATEVTLRRINYQLKKTNE
jgi:hypothetical protein